MRATVPRLVCYRLVHVWRWECHALMFVECKNCGDENDSDEELLGNDDEIGYAGWVSTDDEGNV